MHKLKRPNDASKMFLEEITSRIIADSGIPSDRYHLGKIIMRSMKDDPNFILQIDGATDEHETSGSVLSRSVRCANAFRNYGIQRDDVIVFMVPNMIDLAVPFYAAIYLGVIVAPIDRTYAVKELYDTFNTIKPKMIFCLSENAPDIQLALNDLDFDALIITFNKGDYLVSLSEFLDQYHVDMSVEDFRPTEIDPNETIVVLLPTSGTTGLPKSAALTHKNMCTTVPILWSRWYDFPAPTKTVLVGAPLQWLTALLHYIISPIMRYTRLQTSATMTQEHAYHLINTYQPTFTILSPTLVTTLIKPGDRDQCDFSCFETIYLGGSAVTLDLIEEIKSITPRTEVANVYGMTELTTIGLQPEMTAPRSCGKPLGCFRYRLINVDTQRDIVEPNQPGELWIKGQAVFKEYYNNPKATEETFAEDRWFKTGDIFYRDENWNFYFVERLKLLLKYKSFQISPVEIESVIRQHPAVMDVAVTGIPDSDCGDLPVALVSKRDGHDLSAQEIKDLVKESLSDAKQLRGGVIFVSEIPMTASTKVHRRKVQAMALEMTRE